MNGKIQKVYLKEKDFHKKVDILYRNEYLKEKDFHKKLDILQKMLYDINSYSYEYEFIFEEVYNLHNEYSNLGGSGFECELLKPFLNESLETLKRQDGIRNED